MFVIFLSPESGIAGRSQSCKMLPRWTGYCQRKGIRVCTAVP